MARSGSVYHVYITYDGLYINYVLGPCATLEEAEKRAQSQDLGLKLAARHPRPSITIWKQVKIVHLKGFH